MKCDDVSRFLIDRDNSEGVPSEVEAHLRECASCRRMVRVHEEAMRSFLRVDDHSGPADADEFTRHVMAAVAREVELRESGERQMSLKSWIVVGTLMVLGFLVLPFSDVLASIRQLFGPAVDVATAVILGVVVTSYICVLVVANHHRMLRWIRHRP
jgi:hypothetical protein